MCIKNSSNNGFLVHATNEMDFNPAKKVDVQRVSAQPGHMVSHVYLCMLQSYVIEVCN
jgi:hypothetical protein